MIAIIIWSTIWGVAGWAVARREHPAWGAFVGATLGPIGVALAWWEMWRERRSAARYAAEIEAEAAPRSLATSGSR